MNNGEDIFFKLVNRAKTVELSAKEKTALFMTIDTFVERNPINSVETKTTKGVTEMGAGIVDAVTDKIKNFIPVKSPFSASDFHFSFSFNTLASRVAIVFLVVAIFGTGTSFAAQSSLPGDILYPVKVNFNEEIKAAFLSDTNRPQYEVDRIKTRVEEAKTLAVQNRLSDKIQTDISNQLNSHIAVVKTELNTLSQKGELKKVFEISNDLTDSLQQDAVSVSVSSQPGNSSAADATIPDKKQAAIVENIISGPREVSAAIKDDAEGQIYTLQKNDDDTLAIAQAKLDSVKTDLQSIQNSLAASQTSANIASQEGTSTETTISVATGTPSATPVSTVASAAVKKAAAKTEKNEFTDSVNQIYNLIKNGQDKLDSKEYNDAFLFFKQADDLTQIIQSKIDIQNEATATTDLESLNLDASPETAVATVGTSTAGTASDTADVNLKNNSAQNIQTANTSQAVEVNVLNTNLNTNIKQGDSKAQPR